mmetsp:Transcript_24752/g.50664  ORF Transcript_24752/g.50664 Transcript_24752/m.50664 type:complete len:250 (+) Transcript_24752:153-902(+)
MYLENLQRLLDEVAQIHAFPLGVVDRVSDVQVLALENVEDRKDLTIVRHQRLPDHLATQNQGLDDLHRRGHELGVASVQGRFDGDDELRNHWQDLSATFLQHIVRPLHSQEAVGILLFTKTIEKYGEVVVVIELLEVDLPDEFSARGTMKDLDGQVGAIVEGAEQGPCDGPPLRSPRLRRPARSSAWPACTRRRAWPRVRCGAGPAPHSEGWVFLLATKEACAWGVGLTSLELLPRILVHELRGVIAKA